jgi:aryl-alcohol dehydrogenase-like predicted oxidoreductase
MGCWAIGSDWGPVDDAESIRALQHGLDLGITFFDTSDVYGCGHSERLLGQALGGRRHQVVVASKFGNICNPITRRITGQSADPAAIRNACEASLKRLGTDYIDLYQFHLGNYPPAAAAEVRDVLEALVREGKIRWYAWSTDDPERARVFAAGEHCTAVQYQLNLFDDAPGMRSLCQDQNLAGIARTPLAMGLLTGKYSSDAQFPIGDIRRTSPWWDYFKRAKMPGLLLQLERVREVLTRDGRTLVRGALGWVLARSEQAIPIPGFKTVAQVAENAATLRYGPLNAAQMQEIDALLARPLAASTLAEDS